MWLTTQGKFNICVTLFVLIKLIEPVLHGWTLYYLNLYRELEIIDHIKGIHICITVMGISLALYIAGIICTIIHRCLLDKIKLLYNMENMIMWGFIVSFLIVQLTISSDDGVQPPQQENRATNENSLIKSMWSEVVLKLTRFKEFVFNEPVLNGTELNGNELKGTALNEISRYDNNSNSSLKWTENKELELLHSKLTFVSFLIPFFQLVVWFLLKWHRSLYNALSTNIEDPEAGIPNTEVNSVAMQPMNTNPPAIHSNPPVDESDPPVSESDLPVDESDLPVGESDPPVGESDPPVDESDPPVGESDPPVDESNPQVNEFNLPAVDVNTPTENSNLSEDESIPQSSNEANPSTDTYLPSPVEDSRYSVGSVNPHLTDEANLQVTNEANPLSNKTNPPSNEANPPSNEANPSLN